MNSDRTHITPINDTKEHAQSANCWCKPAVDELLIVHNAADGREFIEEEELDWLAMQRALDIMAADLSPTYARRAAHAEGDR